VGMSSVAGLEIAFTTKRLRQICEREAVARRALGDDVANRLFARLADFKAARSVSDLVAGRPRNVNCDGAEHIEISLGGHARLFFTANHPTIPTKGAKAAVDWAAVRRIKITCVESDDDRREPIQP
jgi:proteic killer suppression protein